MLLNNYKNRKLRRFFALGYSKLFSVNSSLALIVDKSLRSLVRLLFDDAPSAFTASGLRFLSQKLFDKTWHV